MGYRGLASRELGAARASEYSTPVFGLIFLRFADHRFAESKRQLAGTATGRRRSASSTTRLVGRRLSPGEARFSSTPAPARRSELGRAIDDAMRAIEAENEELRDVLPKTYMGSTTTRLSDCYELWLEFRRLGRRRLRADLRVLPRQLRRSPRVRRGGEFFTPQSIVRLIVEIIEPFHGKVFDPACGSGGMFVQCAKFVASAQRARQPASSSSTARSRRRRPSRLGRDEPRRARAVGRHPPGQQLLRGPARRASAASTS